MYSPTTRLLTLLELLQSNQQLSGPDLARRLEIDVRTVRRYILMLQDMGIPVEAEREPYGAYHLRRGHHLPPLTFTDAEAVALNLGLMVIRELRFPVEVAAVEGAVAKTERLMPEKLLKRVRGLQEAIAFNVEAPPMVLRSELVVDLSTAVQQRRRVRLHYRSWGGQETEREFDPFGIVFNDGFWHTIGFCHLRQDVRTFRLDRIHRLALTTQSFERPTDFDVVDHLTRSVAFLDGSEQIEVVLETTLERARQAITPIMGILEPVEQGVVFRRSAMQLEWIAHVLISLDFPVRVIQPAALRNRLRQIAARALELADGQAM